MYKVKLEKFEGPLDLLLGLIESNKLDITEISLAEVAGQYLECLEKMDNVEMDYLAYFLNIASRLILIKSRALLPKLQVELEEEKDIVDLKRQLELYQKFRKISPELAKIMRSDSFFASRDVNTKKMLGFYPPANLCAKDLKKIFEYILIDCPSASNLPQEIMTKSISIKEKIDFIKTNIASRIKTTLQEMIDDTSSKTEAVVTFLAVLELLKKKFIIARQENAFADIMINLNEK